MIYIRTLILLNLLLTLSNNVNAQIVLPDDNIQILLWNPVTLSKSGIKEVEAIKVMATQGLNTDTTITKLTIGKSGIITRWQKMWGQRSTDSVLIFRKRKPQNIRVTKNRNGVKESSKTYKITDFQFPATVDTGSFRLEYRNQDTGNEGNNKFIRDQLVEQLYKSPDIQSRTIFRQKTFLLDGLVTPEEQSYTLHYSTGALVPDSITGNFWHHKYLFEKLTVNKDTLLVNIYMLKNYDQMIEEEFEMKRPNRANLIPLQRFKLFHLFSLRIVERYGLIAYMEVYAPKVSQPETRPAEKGTLIYREFYKYHY